MIQNKWWLLIGAVYTALVLAGIATVLYVVAHFITKYW